MLTRGIKAADAILSGIVILIITGMLLYGGYSLWDTAAVYRNAYLDDTLKKIKPTDQGGTNPSLEELKKIAKYLAGIPGYEKCPRYERSAHTATPRAMLAKFDAISSNKENK